MSEPNAVSDFPLDITAPIQFGSRTWRKRSWGWACWTTGVAGDLHFSDASEEQTAMLETIATQRAAVETFLGAEGHDLCHENRVLLAKAFGLEHRVPQLVSREEFEKGCQRYQDELYGVTRGGETDALTITAVGPTTGADQGSGVPSPAADALATIRYALGLPVDASLERVVDTTLRVIADHPGEIPT